MESNENNNTIRSHAIHRALTCTHNQNLLFSLFHFILLFARYYAERRNIWLLRVWNKMRRKWNGIRKKINKIRSYAIHTALSCTHNQILFYSLFDFITSSSFPFASNKQKTEQIHTNKIDEYAAHFLLNVCVLFLSFELNMCM